MQYLTLKPSHARRPSNNHLRKLMKVRHLKTGNGNTFGWQECWKLTRFQSFFR